MEWREQSAVSCDRAFQEAQSWIEAVTKKTFGSNDFRSALENGVLLCDLINKIKPGIVRKVNRLPTPIAGLDNLNVFLKACVKLGLKEAQLFHPGDLQDLSSRVTVKHQETNRRLKNVLITIYWLGRRAHCERLYDGPYLNFKAFEGLLGSALYKALQELSGQKGSSVRDSGFGDNWYSEREEDYQQREGGGGHRRDDSLDSLDSLGSRTHSVSSDTTLKGSSEGCCSDTEADSVFRMADNKDSLSYRRSVVITPKVTTQFNQFLPSKDKSSGYVPAPLRKKRAERNEDHRRSWANPMYTEEDGTLTSDDLGDSRLSFDCLDKTGASGVYEYESGSDSDADRPDPDVVLDDLASRRFHSPSPAPPTNFAVPINPLVGGRVAGGQRDASLQVTMTPNVVPQQNVTCLSGGIHSGDVQPPQQGSMRVDHRRAVCTDSLFRETYDDSEDEDDDVGYADPVQDDLYTRKLGLKPQVAASASYDKFLPKFWTPEEDVHIQKIKLGSQRRPWYKKIQGFSYKKSGSSSDDSESDISPWLSSGPPPSNSHTHEASAHTTLVVGKRQRQTRDSIDGSKSTSDIQADPAATRKAQMEELQKYREQVKEGDDKWQDDLSKWKSRRRSVNSDIVKKKEEREKVEQVTFGGDNRRSKTFREMQEERETKRHSSVGSRLGSFHFDEEEDVFDRPVIVPRSRVRPERSYTIDTPYSSDPPEPPQKEDKPPAASPATSQEAETVYSRASSRPITPTARSSLDRPQLPAAAPLPRSPVRTSTAKTEETSTAVSSLRSVQKVPEPRRPLLGTQTEAPSSGSLYKQPPQPSSMEPKPPGVSRVSASLPRSYQRPDSARLTSVMTARPFGTQPSRLSSLPRPFTMDNSNKRVNGDVGVSTGPSRDQRFMTPEDSQSSSSSSSEDEEEQEKTAGKSVTSTQSVTPVPLQAKSEAPVSPAPAKDTSQESSCETRISLNQKPNSSRDFGFLATWDSTGAHVTSVKPGSPAEMFQLQPGDEVLTVNGHQVAEMSYTDWKASMEEALQGGSLVMDVRRHGKNSFPDSNAVNSSVDLTSRMSTERLPSTRAAAHPVINMASNGVNGGFRDDSVTTRNKESETISLKNLKRRSEFFEQGGSESVMPDIPVPSIAPSSSRWSWDPEEERRRQEKWQKEQERLLQEKYKRDQEKLQDEWLKAQEEISKSGDRLEPRSLEVNSHSLSPLSPLSPISQSWEEEERKRKEEQERQRQAEERRRREEEERELQRLQEERKRKERQEEERRRREEEERELQEERKRKERQEEERRRREEEERELQRLQEERKRKEMQEEERRWREKEEQERQRLQEERRRKEMQEEEREREEEERRWQRRRDEEERKMQEAAAQQRRERDRALEQQHWTGGSHVFEERALSFADRSKSKSSPQLDEDEERTGRKGVHVQPGGMAHWLLEEQFRSARDKRAQSERAASELEMERRNILNAMKYREPERVTGSGPADRKGQPPLTAAELERQEILNEMKKKNALLTDSSWIRQRSANIVANKEADMPTMRRGESLDNLDGYNSWRSSGRPRSSSQIQNYSRPHSALSGSASYYSSGLTARPGSATLPSSHSMGSLRGKAGTPSSPWSRQSPSSLSPSSLSPTTSPEPTFEAGGLQQRSRSVSGKKICTFCDSPLGKGAAMIIESLGLCYHLGCFKCIDCKSDLGGSEAGAEVRIRNKQLYCNSCYVRFKTGQPTSM